MTTTAAAVVVAAVAVNVNKIGQISIDKSFKISALYFFVVSI
jgi:hypothetical protein